MTLAEDETWRGGMRLVALDPVSGFILVEQVVESRSSAAWTQALAQGLDGLNVTVTQGTSDEAKGLARRSATRSAQTVGLIGHRLVA